MGFKGAGPIEGRGKREMEGNLAKRFVWALDHHAVVGRFFVKRGRQTDTLPNPQKKNWRGGGVYRSGQLVESCPSGRLGHIGEEREKRARQKKWVPTYQYEAR